MAIRTREELMAAASAIFGEQRGDDVIAFVEDLTDTLTDYEQKGSNSYEQQFNDLKSKYDELDNQWRDRYYSRFFGGAGEDPLPPANQPKPSAPTFNDIFDVKE